ncbi:hypothetical protein GGS26DRAFT_591695 [Hypomontagnella submonticulosa]|nr:hypothetical protein GGS26DRAFT_591695 [Hypomontagnella submonticulosa]
MNTPTDRLKRLYNRRIARNPHRARSLPLPGDYPSTPKSPPPAPYLPHLRIQLQTPRLPGQPKVVYCPKVPTPPKWSPSTGYGLREKGIKTRDARSLDDNFPFPFKLYTTEEVIGIPDQTLAEIITNKERTPVLSYRQDTQNYVSRIAPGLVAK